MNILFSYLMCILVYSRIGRNGKTLENLKMLTSGHNEENKFDCRLSFADFIFFGPLIILMVPHFC
jgi:hypothetical protein